MWCHVVFNISKFQPEHMEAYSSVACYAELPVLWNFLKILPTAAKWDFSVIYCYKQLNMAVWNIWNKHYTFLHPLECVTGNVLGKLWLCFSLMIAHNIHNTFVFVSNYVYVLWYLQLPPCHVSITINSVKTDASSVKYFRT